MSRRAVGRPVLRPVHPPVGRHSRHTRDLVFSVAFLLPLFALSWAAGFVLMLLK